MPSSIVAPKVEPAKRLLKTPTIILTMADQAASLKVIRLLEEQLIDLRPVVKVFDSEDELKQFFHSQNNDELGPSRAVVLFDVNYVRGCMKHIGNLAPTVKRLKVPSWAHEPIWGVAVHRLISDARARTVANQVYADYVRRFEAMVSQGKSPWGTIPTGTNQQHRQLTWTLPT